ncbi:MAG: HAMP domain-containing histidine kinase [Treponemataceae bacterium]|nr:HAMP domain-containing histidine kinase [Treponemataceae bacterium]
MDVISKLRVKFIITIVFILTLIFSVIFFVINIMSTHITETQVEERLHELADNDGMYFSPGFQYKFMDALSGSPLSGGYMDSDMEPPEESSQHYNNLMRNKKDRFMFFSFTQPFDVTSMRNYFSVKLDKNGEILDIVSPFPLHFTQDEVAELVDSIPLSDNDFGFLGGLGYLITCKIYGFIIVFAEVQAEANLHATIFKISMYLYVLSLVISVVVAWFFSKWAVKPVRLAFEKQKSFVADASHELKTPLSVISANLDVLSGETGDNKWIGYIRGEISRMSKLVKDLLYLAKCDSQNVKYQFSSFDLSRAVMSAVLPFESTIFEQEKVLETYIAENIQYTGDENAIKQIAVILLDNAVKHTEKNAYIKVSLFTQGNKIVLSVRNTGAGISPKDQKLIFERFYRTDKSRARNTGGYGLGLSIAKSIADIHHSKLSVNSVEGEYAEFSLVL